MKNITEQDLQELTLLLLYLNSWDENANKKYGPHAVLRAWKGYEFATLDALQEQELIDKNNSSKSLYITDQGIEHAQQLIEKYLNK